MDDDWEAAADAQNDLEKVVGNAVENVWANEDESDDELLADDWDVDPEELERRRQAEEAKSYVKPKALSQKKIEEKMRKLEMEATRRAANMTEEDKYAEKARLQKKVEEEDHKLAEELFMGAPTTASVVVAGDTIDSIVLKTDGEFLDFADRIAAKVVASADGKNDLVVQFLKQIITQSSEDFNVDTMNVVKNCVNALCNEKRKSVKGAKKKGGAAKTKKYLNTGADGGKAGVNDASLYDDYVDDYDFI